MTPDDWTAVARIYRQGIDTRNATFETEVPTWESWDRTHLPTPRLVARRGSEVLGWAALSPVSDRCAYAGVAENSVYVDASARGQGLGRELLGTLVARAESAGIWTVQTGIFPENASSVRVHEACGFRVVGVRRRIGRLEGRWRDVLFMERRSQTVGAD